VVLDIKLQELEQIEELRLKVEAGMQAVYDQWPQAQWVDEVRGIGMVTGASPRPRLRGCTGLSRSEGLDLVAPLDIYVLQGCQSAPCIRTATTVFYFLSPLATAWITFAISSAVSS
jgi:hypothetical protein